MTDASKPGGSWLPGEYRLIRQLGRGASGEVWLTEQLATGRQYAIKRFRGTTAEPMDGDPAKISNLGQAERLRFKREFLTLSRLNVPGVVRAHSVIASEGELLYSMEYAEGVPLHEYLASDWWVANAAPGESPPPPSEKSEQAYATIWSLFDQLLVMLSGIHREGMVHRDLKPEHLLVDKYGRLRLIDFSLAAAQDNLKITRHGEVLGTPYYMAPEQAMGLPSDGRSDLYSVGVMLYEIVTGRRPYEGETAIALLMNRVTRDPEPPVQFNPALPPALSDFILRLMARDPAARPVGALQAVDELRTLIPWRPKPQSGPRRTRPGLLRPAWQGQPGMLEQVRRHLERLLDGERASLLVEGVHGSGKTRLGEELRRMAHELNIPVLALDCAVKTDYGSWQRREILHQLPCSAGGHVHPPEETHADATPAELRKLILERAAAGPLVIWLDNLHRAEVPLIELAGALARSPGEGAPPRLLLAGSVTPDTVHDGRSFRELVEQFDHPVEVLALGPLEEEECGALVLSALGVRDYPTGSLGRDLLPLCEGRPGPLLELLRLHLDHDYLRWLPEERRWDFKSWRAEFTQGQIRPAAYPLSALVRIGARFNDLSELQRAALSMAAAFRAEFKFRWWLALCGIPEPSLLEVLEMSLRERWLVDRGGERFEMPHAQLRPAMLAGFQADDLRAIHSRIVQLLEADEDTAHHGWILAEHAIGTESVDLIVRHLLPHVNTLVSNKLHHEAGRLISRASQSLGGTEKMPPAMIKEFERLHDEILRQVQTRETV